MREQLGPDIDIAFEPICRLEDNFARTVAEGIEIVDAVAAPRIKLLADLYHLTVNGDDVSKAITTYAEHIAHVQVADAPGRNEPGTGEIPIDQYLGELRAAGYDGWVGLEYKPSGPSAGSFAWLHRN